MNQVLLEFDDGTDMNFIFAKARETFPNAKKKN